MVTPEKCGLFFCQLCFLIDRAVKIFKKNAFSVVENVLANSRIADLQSDRL